MPIRVKRRLFAICLAISIVILVRQYSLYSIIKDHTFRGETMGTSFSIALAHTRLKPDEFEKLKREITGILENVNNSMSDYIKDSEISIFNNSHDINESYKISHDFFIVISNALKVYRESGGYFDITVSPLVNLWGFGPGTIQDTPEDEDIKAVLSTIGSDLIVLGVDHTLKKTTPNLRINVNAIAKGFAADKIAEYLSTQKCNNYMVEIGGEIVSRGRNAKGNIWRIGIDTPDSKLAPGETIQAVVELRNRAMATSGDYRIYLEKRNKRYSHIIDPTTGYPVTHNLASVSVIADNCMIADAYATTLFVMGMEKGLEWISKKNGVEAYFITRNEDGSFNTSATEGFKIL